MIVDIIPGPRTGSVRVPCSKSRAHRLLIAAALGREPVSVECDGISRDIEATAACLAALGAGITRTGSGYRVEPIRSIPADEVSLPCGESGTTLRFLLPVAGALGIRAVFRREGRLPERPLAPLDRELTAHGMELTPDGALLRCAGRLTPGAYELPGNVSSQYVSGLLMTLPLLDGESTLAVTGKVESAAYITMTEQVLSLAGIELRKSTADYSIPGGQRYALPPAVRVEGDWSSAAFFLCMGAMSENGVTVAGLDPDSEQGDRAVLEILTRMGAEVRWSGSGVTVRRGELHGTLIDAAPVPDLIPALSAAAALATGETRIINAARLRLKESDRLESTAAMLRAVGGGVEELSDGLVITGRDRLDGGSADTQGDHRIAMAAAVAACGCTGSVTVDGAECVAKSYPGFWEDFSALKGESS